MAGSIPEFAGDGEGTYKADGTSSVLTFLVDRQIVVDVARDRGVEVTDADRDQGRTQLLGALGQDEAAAKKVFDRLSTTTQDKLVDAEAAQVALQADLGRKVEDPEAQALEVYEANPDQYSLVCLSALTVADDAAFAVARTRIEGGEDFAAVARDVSTDENAANGGELECIPLTQITDPTASEQIGAAANGDLVGPIGQPGQLVLVQVRDRTRQPFDAVKDQILQQLPPAGQEELEAYLGPRRSKAQVTVNPRFGRWDAKAGAVVPPKQPRGAVTTPPVAPAGG
ncbi:MAG: peptidyl-prolyl cis-trans isomerase [Acidimicrobiales bacterium]